MITQKLLIFALSERWKTSFFIIVLIYYYTWSSILGGTNSYEKIFKHPVKKYTEIVS